jgi:N-acetylglutamate synthase-like GNAT family acetyltransferase
MTAPDGRSGVSLCEAVMRVQIRRASDDDIDVLTQLAVAAWVPVFASFRQVLGPTVYGILYPDWERQQRAVVERICTAEATTVWIAEADGAVAGFIAYTLDHAEQMGVVELLAVHPDHQNRGIGTALNRFALAQMKDAGMRLASVSTGGDPGHAPARRAYEKAGYTALPTVWYYQAL